MSCAAILLVRDEEDIIEWTVRHFVTQVDEVLVWDNLSSDGTRAILDGLVAEGLPLLVFDDPESAYLQSQKMSFGGQVALERGHQWGVFGDADECWMTTDQRPIREYLNGLAPDIRVVNAQLFNHIPTGHDPPVFETDRFTNELIGGEPNPFRRIGWRKREHAPLPKVCVRLHPELVVRQGNHAAWLPGIAPTTGGLVVRHYSWRSEEQYVHKIEVGSRAYAATDMPEGVGGHWRMFGLPPDDPDQLAEWRQHIAGHFYTWFWSADPRLDESLIFDPAPIEQE